MQKDRYTQRIPLTSAIVQKLSRIDSFKGFWEGGLRLHPRILTQLRKWVIITSTGASTRIEGSKMSDADVTLFLRGLHTKPPKNRDEQEVAGYADLAGRVFDNYTTLQLAEGYILQFHAILLQFSEKDQRHCGKYKVKDNIVVARTHSGEEKILFRPTQPYLAKKEMDDVLEWTRSMLASDALHPILVICNFIFEFLAIHPFEDGNGRLSRILTNMLLLQAGYAYVPYTSLEEIIENHQVAYYQSLRATQANHKTGHEDITPWVHFMLDVLLEQVEKAQSIMQSEHPENMLSESQTTIYALFATNEELAIADIAMKLRDTMPRATIKQGVSRLVRLDLLERIGRGRGTRYRLAGYSQ